MYLYVHVHDCGKERVETNILVNPAMNGHKNTTFAMTVIPCI